MIGDYLCMYIATGIVTMRPNYLFRYSKRLEALLAGYRPGLGYGKTASRL